MIDDHVSPLARVNARIKAVVESEMLDSALWTGGIISKVYHASSGHIYFTLSDGDFSIRCILYEDRRGSIPFTPQDGMEVDVKGRIGVFDQKAMIQIIVEEMKLVQGQVMSNFAPVRERLEQMGLYPPQKQIIPPTIQSIMLITSRNGEAETDFRNTYNDAGGTASIKTEDVRVEGDYAAREIADAIKRVNREKSGDVIVLTRGGGRRQMLAVFDDFTVAQAICRSEIPIVTGIGHARDKTLADELADASKDTPTAAAFYLANLRVAQQHVIILAMALLLLVGLMGFVVMVFLSSGAG